MIAGNFYPLSKTCRLGGIDFIFRCDLAFSNAFGNIECLVRPIGNGGGCIAFAIDTNANWDCDGPCITRLDIVQGTPGGWNGLTELLCLYCCILQRCVGKHPNKFIATLTGHKIFISNIREGLQHPIASLMTITAKTKLGWCPSMFSIPDPIVWFGLRKNEKCAARFFQ